MFYTHIKQRNENSSPKFEASHGCEYVDVGSWVVTSWIPTFRGNILLPSSGLVIGGVFKQQLLGVSAV